jgi:hypothetical protein
MTSQDSDQTVLSHIQRLVAEEHHLFERGTALDDSDSKRLKTVQIELDQCWDLLRQRRALRETGHPVSEAQVRPPEIVEKYIG